LLVGFEPARLPRELLNIAAYKLTFLAAGGLLVAGAVALRRERGPSSTKAAGIDRNNDPAALGEGFPGSVSSTQSGRPERVADHPARRDG
jgi:hypothetical protein